jgi:threonylcarbamoyladenosine tRNA methylthiotransferase MtaB
MLERDRPTVAVESLGCKLNQAEAQQMERQLAAAGYRQVPPGDKADIYILNTCTVTHVADRKSRHLLRLARRRNPAVRLVVTGCYAERAPGDLARLEGVELVLGNDLKDSLVGRLKGAGPPKPGTPAPREPMAGRRARAFIKVQEGCRGGCTYCIVPLVRGGEASVPAADVLARIGERAAGGCREVVLTGTEIGRYESGELDLKGLLEMVLAETEIPRIRLSSLQPPEVTPGLLGLWQDRRLCPHFHLSLQSGGDAVLGRMKRRYTAGDYLETVNNIRRAVPEAAITTDIIVGFPGETDAEFRETLDLCREVGFARVHVFPYSPRLGTAAASMPGQVPEQVKRSRAGEALALAAESARAFQGRFLATQMEVLWEKATGGVWSGLTGNYIRIYAQSTGELTNRLTVVTLEGAYRDGVWGRLS